MMEKKETTAQTAEAPNEEVEEPQQFQLIPEMHVDKKTKVMAKKFGIDVDALEQIPLRINAYVAENEKRWAIMAQQQENLKPLLQLGQQLAQRQQTQEPAVAAPQANAGMMGALAPILQMLPSFLGSGGDNQFQELAQKSLLSQIRMSQAITDAVVAKITQKATSDVAEAVTGG